MPLKKIVVIGPESTGKSTLCEALAAHYHTVWVREYAREYLTINGMQYSYDDLSVIARGQLALEDMGTAIARSFLFIDTDLYVIKVWGEYVFGRCEAWILDEIARRKYDAILLCRTDLPWADDPLREYPDHRTRERLFHIYKDLLVNQSTPWAEIGGEGPHRLRQAIDVVDRLLQ